MANALYDSFREQCLDSTVDLFSDAIKMILTDHADDNPDPTVDDFLDDIASAARVSISPNFANKSITDGIFDADDVTFAAVTGDISESMNLFDDTPGTEATKDMIAKIDTASGLPVTPVGGDIVCVWSSDTNKIFKL